MAFLAVDKNGDESVFNEKPIRIGFYNNWMTCEESDGLYVMLPTGSIEKLIGRKISWNDEPVEIK